MTVLNEIREWLVQPVLDRIEKLEKIMADNTEVLNDVASGLSRLGSALTEVFEENARLRGRNAELEGEDASESLAAARVKAEFDNLATVVSGSEDVSEEVTPIPEPPAAGEGSDSPVAPSGENGEVDETNPDDAGFSSSPNTPA